MDASITKDVLSLGDVFDNTAASFLPLMKWFAFPFWPFLRLEKFIRAWVSMLAILVIRICVE
jgi:hypothetical protein